MRILSIMMPLIRNRSCAFLLLLCAGVTTARAADGLSQLSENFWEWRAQEQPFSEDDMPRIERPQGFAVDWSPRVVQQRRQQLTDFEKRWRELAPAASAPIAEQVDYRLVGSALARVRWELDIEQAWKRNPKFYVDQTLGAMYVLLLPPPPFSAERQRQVINRLESVPATLRAAQENLTDMRQPFALLAIEALNDLPARMQKMQSALAGNLTAESNTALAKASAAAVPALTQYRAWLERGCRRCAKTLPLAGNDMSFFCAMSRCFRIRRNNCWR